MSVQLREALHGVGVTPTTPFSADLSMVDRGALADNLTHLVEHGVRLIYVAANTGEVASLSPEEWTVVVETAAGQAGGQAGEAVVAAGIGHEYPVAIELARRAKTMGVAGILAMPRLQPYMTSAGLVAYWTDIIETAELPAVVYKRGFPDTDDLADLLAHELVVGCKYAERDISDFAATVAADTSGVVWTCGIAERYAPFFAGAGSVGFTSGLANFAPQVALAMQQALVDGDLSSALAIREACLPIEQARARHGDAYNVAAVKTAMDAVGLAGGRVRPPLVDVDSGTVDEVDAIARSMLATKEGRR